MTFLDAHNYLNGRKGYYQPTTLMDFKSEVTGTLFRDASPKKIYQLTGSVEERTDLTRTDGLTAEGVWAAFKEFSDALEAA